MYEYINLANYPYPCEEAHAQVWAKIKDPTKCEVVSSWYCPKCNIFIRDISCKCAKPKCEKCGEPYLPNYNFSSSPIASDLEDSSSSTSDLFNSK